jgi:hypothetical protein
LRVAKSRVANREDEAANAHARYSPFAKGGKP